MSYKTDNARNDENLKYVCHNLYIKDSILKTKILEL